MKKCNYCDDYARVKSANNGLYDYLCSWCYKHMDKARQNLNFS